MSEEQPVKRGRGRPPGASAPKTDAKKIPKTASARIAEYVRTMPKLQLNDITLLQAMVFMEIELPRFQKKIAKMKDGREIKAATEGYNNTLKEYRLLQEALGIGRNQRSDEIDMQGEVDRLVQESEELVKKYGVEIACSFCVEVFELGTFIFHFRDDVGWRIQFTCPKCGKTNLIQGDKPIPTDKMLVEAPSVN